MNYSQLHDLELIRYAFIDAPGGSLAALLAARFEDNVECIADLEKEYRDAEAASDDEHYIAIETLKSDLAAAKLRIRSLENANAALSTQLRRPS